MKGSKPVKVPSMGSGIAILIVSVFAIVVGFSLIGDRIGHGSGMGILDELNSEISSEDFYDDDEYDSGYGYSEDEYYYVRADEYGFGDGDFDYSLFTKKPEYATEGWYLESLEEERERYIEDCIEVTADNYFSLDYSSRVKLELTVKEFAFDRAWIEGKVVQSEDYYLIGTDSSGKDWYVSIIRMSGDPQPVQWKQGDEVVVYANFGGDYTKYDDDSWENSTRYPSVYCEYIEAR